GDHDAPSRRENKNGGRYATNKNTAEPALWVERGGQAASGSSDTSRRVSVVRLVLCRAAYRGELPSIRQTQQQDAFCMVMPRWGGDLAT
ncbi:MAG: hypothetical protein WA009_08185, partial [Phototrophicaceae bacterium]